MQPLELIDYLIQLDVWQKEDTLIRRIDYTLLVEAFDSPALLHFIGWSYPIDPSKLLVPHAVELMQWLFGSERLQKRPIIDDAMKDIDRLELVIGNTEALRDLRRSNDLVAAYSLA